MSEMVHARVESNPEIALTGTGGLTVGDWVEVLHDFSPGHNSEGDVGVIIEIIERLSNVRYIVDGHVEKFIPLTRLTTIPMPHRREKAKLRTRSSQPEASQNGTIMKLEMSSFPISNLRLCQDLQSPTERLCGVR